MMTPDQEDSEDALQDTFLRAYVFKTEMISGQ
jgi:DNA-directed RNA polymerase specialized sigma24 family protein